MKPVSLIRYRGCILLLAMTVFVSGCSASGTEPREELAPLVGTWRAQALILTNQANPDDEIDLVDQGAVFDISILSTGSYTANLTFLAQPNTEIGTIEVSGSQITMTPIEPPGPATQGSWSIQGGILFLDGTTEFDFNLDGSDEPADIHIEFYPLTS